MIDGLNKERYELTRAKAFPLYTATLDAARMEPAVAVGAVKGDASPGVLEVALSGLMRDFKSSDASPT